MRSEEVDLVIKEKKFEMNYRKGKKKLRKNWGRVSQETFIFLMTDDIASVFYATENEPVEREKPTSVGERKSRK